MGHFDRHQTDSKRNLFFLLAVITIILFISRLEIIYVKIGAKTLAFINFRYSYK